MNDARGVVWGSGQACVIGNFTRNAARETQLHHVSPYHEGAKRGCKSAVHASENLFGQTVTQSSNGAKGTGASMPTACAVSV